MIDIEKVDSCHKVKMKSVPRSEAQIKVFKNRIARIIGQLQGVSKMIEEQRYCKDILIQVSAIEKAIKGVGYEIFKEHFKTCVAGEIKNGNDEIFDETMDLIKKI